MTSFAKDMIYMQRLNATRRATNRSLALYQVRQDRDALDKAASEGDADKVGEVLQRAMNKVFGEFAPMVRARIVKREELKDMGISVPDAVKKAVH